MNVLKAIVRGFAWSVKNLFWRPLVWTVKAIEDLCKPKKKPEYKTSSTLSDVQAAASKDLPQLTKLVGDLNLEKKKLSDKLSTVNADIKAATALIKAAGGDLGQYQTESKGNNGGNKNKNKGNNNNKSNDVAKKDADFD